MFGNPADIIHSSEPVKVGLPVLDAGQGLEEEAQEEGDEEEGEEGRGKSGAGAGAGVLEAGDSSEDDEEEEEEEEGRGPKGAKKGGRKGKAGDQEEEEEGLDGVGVVAAAAAATYERRDAVTGAPQPLAPQLVTLSLLPRSQWQSLVHLDAIKARNK